MVLDLALVGTGGMMPLPNRWLASVLVRSAGQRILFDCGEATQISLRALGWGIRGIGPILISHVHGDHLAGLPGLLLTQGNAARVEPQDVYGPPGLARVVEGLMRVAPYLPFELRCHEIEDGATFPIGSLHVRAAAADHSVPCLAYRLDLPRSARFLPEQAARLGVPKTLWSHLARGQSVLSGGSSIRPEQVLGPPRPGLAVGLVTDTRPTPALERLVTGVDLLVCEGTYGDSADQPRAVERKHMTFAEAAALARDAAVGELLLTHFSPALPHPEEFLAQAQAIFPNTRVGHDHLSLSLAFDDR